MMKMHAMCLEKDFHEVGDTFDKRFAYDDIYYHYSSAFVV